ncbi:MAG: type II secretion system secretin GspD [Nitrospirae bacterium]|nr:type II secretion system secretin GspD [Nitrospirota bacterium]MBF0591786.1 type II secretion system secretin GspD [Nitrospirota bacterium]
MLSRERVVFLRGGDVICSVDTDLMARLSAIIALILICLLVWSGAALAADKEDEKVVFNFVGVELPAIAKFVSELTGKNIIFDEQLKGKITIVAPSPLNKSDAFRLFTSVLELKGYTVVPAGTNTYKIVPSVEAKHKGIELSTVDERIINEGYIARLIQLENLSSDEAVQFLRPIVSKDGYIGEFNPRNILLVIDSGPNMEKILHILKKIDQPSTMDQPEIVFLRNASADPLAKTLNEGFQKVGARHAAQQQQGSARVDFYVVADKRLNALVIFGSKNDREPIKQLISMLDVPSPEAQGSINVYFLENANAAELAKVLDTLIKRVQPGQDKAGEKAQAMPFAASGDILITPDEATNSLVIIASRNDYNNLIDVIKKLDRRRKQVFVEALIIEVSIDDLVSLGSKWRAMATKNGQPAFTFGSGQISSTTMQSVIYGLSGFGIGGMGNFVNVPFTTFNSDGTTTSSTLSVPGYAALFSLDDFKDVINILSTPQILTSDNKEAEIMVGENVPFISRRESDPTRTLSVMNAIERKDVGISLKLTPHITEGDYLKIELYQEISAVKAEPNADITISIGPTTTKRSTKTTVFVKDNETVVIGGLIQEKDEETIEKVPFFGDIPLLGWLFKQKSSTKTKINLMVFLTPHIIHNSDGLKKITEEKDTFIKDSAKMPDQKEPKETTKGPERLPERLIIRFKEYVDKEQAEQLINNLGATIVKAGATCCEKEVEQSQGIYVVTVPPGKDPDGVLSEIQDMPQVKFAESERLLKQLQR